MTEDEAKTKWCPAVRILIAPQDATWQGALMTNRGVIPADPRDTNCIASDCMMWVEYRIEEDIYGHCGLIKK